MCTAITYQTQNRYFGRTLDHTHAYVEEVTISPRRYPFPFRTTKPLTTHFALIGMAYVQNDYPLYYDAINEKGLGIAGLNFTESTRFHQPDPAHDRIAVYEFIPWILGQCGSIQEACALIDHLSLTDTPFHDTLPTARLHWMIAGHDGAITVESDESGLHVYPNPVGVLTNEPPFRTQLFLLNQYMHLSAETPTNQFLPQLDLDAYSHGMGALGLPGDLSSTSRFVRAAFVRANSVCGSTELDSVNQFFHILGAVEQQRGCCAVAGEGYETTLYTSCCNLDRGIYYYTTYENHQITAVDMHHEDLNSSRLIRYPLIRNEQIYTQNKTADLSNRSCEIAQNVVK